MMNILVAYQHNKPIENAIVAQGIANTFGGTMRSKPNGYGSMEYAVLIKKPWVSDFDKQEGMALIQTLFDKGFNLQLLHPRD